ncbi:MAG: hypothetical protein VW270_18885 [Candidatus Poseidoniales archaeon]
MKKQQKTQAERDTLRWKDRLKARRLIYPFPRFQRECALLTESDLFGEIYIAENLVNQKQYCGKSEFCAEWRWCRLNRHGGVKGGHVSEILGGSTSYFHNAVRKYGTPEQFYLDGFKLTVIYHARTEDELNAKEKQVIAERDLMNRSKGYNGREGGDGGGLSDSVKERISKGKRDWWASLSEEEREKKVQLGTDALKNYIDSLTEKQRKEVFGHGLGAKSPDECNTMSLKFAEALKTDPDALMRFRHAIRLRWDRARGYLDGPSIFGFFDDEQ